MLSYFGWLLDLQKTMFSVSYVLIVSLWISKQSIRISRLLFSFSTTFFASECDEKISVSSAKCIREQLSVTVCCRALTYSFKKRSPRMVQLDPFRIKCRQSHFWMFFCEITLLPGCRFFIKIENFRFSRRNFL